MALPSYSGFPVRQGLKRQRKFRRWHRWLAVVTAVQLLAWTLSGVFFAFIDIEYVRGSHHRVAPAVVSIDLSVVEWSAAETSEITLRHRLPGELVVGVSASGETRWHSVNGELLSDLTADQVLQVAEAATDLAPDRAVWITEPVLGSEYRGRPLPLWQVFNSAEPTTVAYLDAVSGEVVAIRNTAWRWWDFLWSLHIMDYDDRDTIGTLLLKAFSLLALLTALMGIALFISLPRKWR